MKIQQIQNHDLIPHKYHEGIKDVFTAAFAVV